VSKSVETREDSYKDIANMLANWALDFNKTTKEALDYMDRVLVLDELTRNAMVNMITNNINKVRELNER
tara:strand:- start:3529 stop:3735 length:207 start_codon:yes stop_codon:yes gene_type:complete